MVLTCATPALTTGSRLAHCCSTAASASRSGLGGSEAAAAKVGSRFSGSGFDGSPATSDMRFA